MLEDYVSAMDQHNIAVCVSLDGEMGTAIDDHRAHFERDHKNRFVVFANLDFRGKGAEKEPASWECNQTDFIHRAVEALRDAKLRGAKGLKFFKAFGLEYRNADGSLIRIDDERFDPIWALCGELDLAVIMHTADPSAFFEPIDEKNERYEELSRRPDWSFHGPRFPRRDALHSARNRVIARHPKTQFIAAHLGNDGEDLAQTSEWLEKLPNLHVEIASRISELGRQPYSAREFFLKHADRILFGTDGPWPRERLFCYWRFLETFDEYFPYSEKSFPPQGFWRIYGIGLPDAVLKKVYHENAAKLLNIDRSWLQPTPATKE
jgi:predicted TIM-barrel fold metal-dependent hydrolase